ncbi:MAG: hypothetical protein ACLFQB_08190 [Chitinispirillaceae bacterium]
MRQDSSPTPWTILVCADLGFDSEIPEVISIENWDHFFKTHRIRIQERIDTFLPQNTSPFTTDYEISSLGDFSSEGCCSKLPILEPILKTKETLIRFIEGLQNLKTTIQTICSIDLPLPLKNRILKAVELETATTNKPASPTRIDTILAQIDLKAPCINEGPYPLAQLIEQAEETDSEYGNEKYVRIRSLIRELDIYSESMVSAVQECPPFFRKKSTWKALELLCRSAAEKESGRILVYSLPREKAEEAFESLIEQFSIDDSIPDIVIWDYEIKLSAAGEKIVTNLAQTAHDHTITVFASLSGQEFIRDEKNTKCSRTVLCNKYRTFNRLRKQEIFRSLAVFGPAVFYEGKGAQDNVFRCGGAWLMAEKLLFSVQNGNFPLDLNPNNNNPKGHFQPIVRSKTGEAQRAAHNGITLFHIPDSDKVTIEAICTYDAPSSKQILSMLDFNLLLNRFSKLAVTQNQSAEFSALKQYLETQLRSFHIFSHGGPNPHSSCSEFSNTQMGKDSGETEW